MISHALFAGKGQMELLQQLLSFPSRQFTIRELAACAKVPYATTWNAVNKWFRAGIVSVSLVGKAKAVTLKNTAYAKQLLRAAETPSPQRAALNKLRKLVSHEPLVARAVVFGSVAEGKEKADSDIDLALLTQDASAAKKIAFKAFEKTGVKTVPLVFMNEKKFDAFLGNKKKQVLK